MNVTLVKASTEDAQAIWCGQREAFLPLLERYRDGDADPANEKLESIKDAIEQEYFYVILADGEFAGALMIEKNPDEKRLKLHTVYVKPALQSRGIAGRAIDIAEKLHAPVEWTLNTPADLEGNRHLYEKKGYYLRGCLKINERLTLAYYSKAGAGAHIYEAVKAREPERGEPLILKKGDAVSVGETYEGPEGWDGWVRCTAEDGASGWVIKSAVDIREGIGIAMEDYSSFELDIEKGERLCALRSAGGWLWCENEQGKRGWVPEEYLKAMS